MKHALIALLAVIALAIGTAHAGDVYYADDDAEAGGDGSAETPFKYIQDGVDVLDAGDTLVIKDGTYTGDPDAPLSSGCSPPILETKRSGTASNYIVIKAENDYGATLDGAELDWIYTSGAPNRMLHNIEVHDDDYVRIEGLVSIRAPGSCIHILNADYVEILRCGAGDPCMAGGTNSSIGLGAHVNYCLVERCFAWGNGRYQIGISRPQPGITHPPDSQYNIFRACIARFDMGMSGEPRGSFSCYSQANNHFFNCIAIDGLANAPFGENANGEWYPFGVACPAMGFQGCSFIGNIILNHEGWAWAPAGWRVYMGLTFKNNITWDINYGGDMDQADAQQYPLLAQFESVFVDSSSAWYFGHNTFGDVTYEHGRSAKWKTTYDAGYRVHVLASVPATYEDWSDQVLIDDVYGGRFGGVEDVTDAMSEISDELYTGLYASRGAEEEEQIWWIGDDGCGPIYAGSEITILPSGATGIAMSNSITMQPTVFHDNIFTDLNVEAGSWALGGTGDRVSPPPITSDYNLYYDTNGLYYNGDEGDDDIYGGQATDPIGESLKYLPRIETDSLLSGAASDGGDIGATVIYQIGPSGSHYGDTGWNVEQTDTPLWPWTDEDDIANLMCNYTCDIVKLHVGEQTIETQLTYQAGKIGEGGKIVNDDGNAVGPVLSGARIDGENEYWYIADIYDNGTIDSLSVITVDGAPAGGVAQHPSAAYFTESNRGFCTDGLTDYIWGYLGAVSPYSVSVDSSYATITGDSAIMTISPGGTDTFTSPTDRTIDVYIKDSSGTGLVFAATDVWLENDAVTPCTTWVADSTSTGGHTTFTGTPYGGISDMSLASTSLTEVMVMSIPIDTLNLRFNSPDLDGDGTVTTDDLALFSQCFNAGAPDSCFAADYNEAEDANGNSVALSDWAIFGAHYNEECP